MKQYGIGICAARGEIGGACTGNGSSLRGCWSQVNRCGLGVAF